MCTYRPPSAKKKAIIKAAEKCFLDKGFQATSIDSIAHQAGVAKQTVYNNFKNKEELFLAIMEDMCKTMYDGALYPTSDKPPKETLFKFAKNFFAMISHPRALAFFRIIISESPQNKELAQSFWNAGPCSKLAQLTEIFKKFHESGQIHAPKPEIAAQHFLTAIKGEFHFRLLVGVTNSIPEKEVNIYLEEVVNRFC